VRRGKLLWPVRRASVAVVTVYSLPCPRLQVRQNRKVAPMAMPLVVSSRSV
jgi:hypothetical protein